MRWRLLDGPGVVDRAYLRRLLAVARRAQRGGLYVLLDMHQDLWSERFQGNGAPDWATKDDGIPFTPVGPFPLNYFSQAVGRSFTSFYENRDGIRFAADRQFSSLSSADAIDSSACATNGCSTPHTRTPRSTARCALRWLKPGNTRL